MNCRTSRRTRRASRAPAWEVRRSGHWLRVLIGCGLLLGIGLGAAAEEGERDPVIRSVVEVPKAMGAELAMFVTRAKGRVWEIGRPTLALGERDQWDALVACLADLESRGVSVEQVSGYGGRIRFSVKAACSQDFAVMVRSRGDKDMAWLASNLTGATPALRAGDFAKYDFEVWAPFFARDKLFPGDRPFTITDIESAVERSARAVDLPMPPLPEVRWRGTSVLQREGQTCMALQVDDCELRKFVMFVWNCGLLSTRPRPWVEGFLWVANDESDGKGTGVIQLVRQGA